MLYFFLHLLNRKRTISDHLLHVRGSQISSARTTHGHGRTSQSGKEEGASGHVQGPLGLTKSLHQHDPT